MKNNYPMNFHRFFIEKVDRIFDSIGHVEYRQLYLPDVPYTKFQKFEEVNFGNMKSIVMKAKTSYCERDPFPIADVKSAKNFDRIIVVHSRITNLSLQNGVFPESEKEACVKPTLKNGLDDQQLLSYRPVSNLSFLSKIMEMAAKDQLAAYLERINFLPGEQSAYRQCHPTETTLCCIMSDLLGSLDDGNCTLIILLDLSAAFDTVVHELLIEDLMYIGVDGDALEWFRSYLRDRSFYVSVNGKSSERRFSRRGVPQGSVLGPLLFTVYTGELS